MKTRAKSKAPGAKVPRRGAREAGGDVGERQRAGVQSLERGFAILERVAQHRDGITLAELSRRVGLHPSTTFHLVQTMVSLGYVRQMKDSKRYRIGTPLFVLASSSLDEVEMSSLATPVLEDLSRRTGESSHFAVRMGDNVVVIARTSGSSVFQLTERVGVVRPAHCTALGKVVLAGLAPEQFNRFLDRAELKAMTPNSIVSPSRLRREIEEVQRRGIAFDDCEFDAEVRCAAVAVHDFTGRLAGAIGISGPVWRLSLQALQSSVPILRAAAERLSAQLGAPQWADAARRSA